MGTDDLSLISGVTLFLIFLLAYWALRGIGQLFERYNPILVLLYLLLLFPLAILHAFLLGIFGQSKRERMRKTIKGEVEKQMQARRHE